MQTLSRASKIGILVLIVTLCGAIAGWHERYTILFYYKMWQLQRDSQPFMYYFYFKDLEHASAELIPIAEKYYAQSSVDTHRRDAAMFIIIVAEPAKSEKFFATYLEHNDVAYVSGAIANLGLLKRYTYHGTIFERVKKFATHPNEEVRRAVVRYLSEFNNKVSRKVLFSIKTTDKSGRVRFEANSALSQLESGYAVDASEENPAGWHLIYPKEIKPKFVGRAQPADR